MLRVIGKLQIKSITFHDYKDWDVIPLIASYITVFVTKRKLLLLVHHVTFDKNLNNSSYGLFSISKYCIVGKFQNDVTAENMPDSTWTVHAWQ